MRCSPKSLKTGHASHPVRRIGPYGHSAPGRASVRLPIRDTLEQISRTHASTAQPSSSSTARRYPETPRHPLRNRARRRCLLVRSDRLQRHRWQHRTMRAGSWQHQSHRKNDAFGAFRQNRRRHRRPPGFGFRPSRTIPHRPRGRRERPCYLRGQGHRWLRRRRVGLCGDKQHRCRHDVWRC